MIMNHAYKEALEKAKSKHLAVFNEEDFESGFKACWEFDRIGEARAWLFTNPANGVVGSTTSKHVADLYQDTEKLFTHSQPLKNLSLSQILSLERRSNMTDDEAIRFVRSVESALVRQPPSPYSIDEDAQGIRKLVCEAITGAMAFGAQGINQPPDGHWLSEFWENAHMDNQERGEKPSAWLFTNPSNGMVGATADKHCADLYSDVNPLFLPPAPAQNHTEDVRPSFNNDSSWSLANKVREDLDRKACPALFMDTAMESINRHYETKGVRDMVDPLQSAAEWLLGRMDKPTIQGLQSTLLIGYNRASRLFEAATINKDDSK